ncbi:MAG: ABC transporter permease [Candidatus Aenigmatarchaeota archaeon]
MNSNHFKHLLRSIWAICLKDIKLYYAKGPIVVTGVIFPFFLWVAFYIGRSLEIKESLASLLTLALFFTSSSVTPIIAPWETRQRTLEMLLSRPITITIMLIGDILASIIFGLIFTLPPIFYGIALGAIPSNFLLMIITILLIALIFSSLGIIFSALPTDTPADVVLLSSTIKLPLIFISGVLISLNQLPTWSLILAMLSPLTYSTDLLRIFYIGKGFFPLYIDLIATFIFAIIFTILAFKLHKKTIFIRLQRR